MSQRQVLQRSPVEGDVDVAVATQPVDEDLGRVRVVGDDRGELPGVDDQPGLRVDDVTG